MHVLVIHLARSTDRRPNVEALLRALPGARIVEAVDGRDPDQIARVDVRPGNLHRPRYPFPMSPGEIGLFLSHRACWQQIVDEDLPGALIAEDDLCLDPDLWPDVRTLITRNLSPDSVIRLPAKLRERPLAEIDAQGRARLFRPRIIGLQTVATVVGRAAAGRLLSASQALDRPVDTFLQMHWATGQRVETIWPSGVSEVAAGGSTIQKKTRTGGKPMREFKRALYRAQVALRPQVKPLSRGS